MEQAEQIVGTVATPDFNLAAIETVGNAEKEMSLSVNETAEHTASMICIMDDESYRSAVEFGRALKGRMAEVTEFFKPMKESANKAHKDICDREKAMLAPLKDAETQLKKAIADYTEELERKRREEEERVKKAVQEAQEKMLAEALQAESEGRTDEAATMLGALSAYESFADGITVESQKLTATGASTSKDWEIVSINEDEVPVSLAGMVIRPVDEKAVLRLIKASKGKIEIPGVKFKETVRVSIRK